MSTPSHTVQTTPPANPIIRMDRGITGVGADSGTEGVKGKGSDRPGVVVDVKDGRNNLKKNSNIPAEEGDSKDKKTQSTVKEEKSGQKLSPRDDLTRQEKKKIRKLKARERKVRAHEMAHLTAARQYAQGGPNYTYERGPDGKRYIVSGSVNFDTSRADTPEKTVEKMEAIKRAALAPAQPSQQDRKVASQAQRALQEARQKLNREESQDTIGEETEPPKPSEENSAPLQPGEQISQADNRIEGSSGQEEQREDESASERPVAKQPERSFSGIQNLRVGQNR